MTRSSLVLGLIAATVAVASPAALAQPVIHATGQLFIPADPGAPPGDPEHYDRYENAVYEIDLRTGVATAVSPATLEELPAGLAGTPCGRLLGFESGQLVQVNPVTGERTSIGVNNGLTATSFDITADGRGFVVPFDENFETQQIHAIDLPSGAATPIGSTTAIGDAIDLARGTPLGTAEPFVISLGSVGETLYGVEDDSGTLVSIDSRTGAASVVGKVGAAGVANGGGYSAFSALTGVDEDLDGAFDALYASVNQLVDASGAQRLGGIARFDLETGEWELVGTNPGIVFFGFGASAAPAPACAADLDGDGAVAFGDLLAALTQWGACDECPADLDDDGAVDFSDILEILTAWGDCA